MKKWHRNRENMKKEYKVQAVKLAKEIVAGKAAKELAVLRKQNKALEREIRRLKEENAFLAEASAFFAASRRKSAKNSE